MRYLQRAKDFMLVYGNNDDLEVIGYVDSNFGGSVAHMKSMSGYAFKMAGGAILTITH